ncbi:MAG: hypothetical protein ACLRI7_10270 [Ruthenibacterium lactatiformans]
MDRPGKYPWNVENGRLVFTGENFRRAMHLWLEMDAKTRARPGERRTCILYRNPEGGCRTAIKAAAETWCRSR